MYWVNCLNRFQWNQNKEGICKYERKPTTTYSFLRKVVIFSALHFTFLLFETDANASLFQQGGLNVGM